MKDLIVIFKGLFPLLSKKAKLSVFAIVFLSFVSIFSVSFSPVLMSKITNDLASSQYINVGGVNFLLWLGICYVFLITITKVVSFTSVFLQSMLRISCLSSVSNKFLAELYNKEQVKDTDENIGSVAQKLNNLTNDLYALINNMAFNIIPPAFQVFFSIFMIVLSGDLLVASIFLIYILFFISANHMLTKGVIKSRGDLMKSGVHAYTLLSDSVKNISAAKSCNSFDYFFKRYSNYLLEDVAIQRKYWKKNSLLIGSTSLLTLLFFSATFLLTLYRTVNNEVTIGHFVMISSYIFLLSSPLDNIGAMLSQVKQSISTLRPFFSNKTNKESSELTGFSHHLEGVEIEIKNLSFHYGDFKLINDMSLSISSGDFVTIKGRSGSGKTTLANIVSRKLPSKDGTVFINNVDINSISERELSDVIYFVTQDECIFMDTVEFNLRIAKPTASREELLDAIRLASLSNDFLAINNDVLSLKLGDNGETLSGGQKQRLSLARLFLRDPKLIILDEITSSLDPFNEDNVMRNIREKFPMATILNISHKDILNNNSDFIITLSDGEIIAFDCKSLTTV